MSARGEMLKVLRDYSGQKVTLSDAQEVLTRWSNALSDEDRLEVTAVMLRLPDYNPSRLALARALADTVRSWGWENRKQESNGELIGRALWEQHDALTTLRAKVERLRGALTTIRDAGLGPDRGSAQWTVDLCRNLARAALKETTP